MVVGGLLKATVQTMDLRVAVVVEKIVHHLDFVVQGAAFKQVRHHQTSLTKSFSIP